MSVESDDAGFQSAENGVRVDDIGVGLKPVGVRLKSIGRRHENIGVGLETMGGGLKNIGVETTDAGFQSAAARFQSNASLFRLSNSSLLFETAVLSTRKIGRCPVAAKTKNTAHRSLAVLDLPKRINVLITFADGVVKAMTGNAYFPSPSPALTAVAAAVTDLQNAETAALARAKGAAATRNAKRAVLVSLLQQLRMYVQSIVDPNAENGPAIRTCGPSAP
jgi:hypothetical protein